MRSASIALFLVLAGCSTVPSTSSTFIVFFNANSSVIAPEALVAVDQAATAIKRNRPGTVAIAAGIAAGNNLRLAPGRYAAVRQALEARGVESRLIAQASLPSSDAAITETGNQRVEIILSPRN